MSLGDVLSQDRRPFLVSENVELMNCRLESLGQGINRFPELRTKVSMTFRSDDHAKAYIGTTDFKMRDRRSAGGVATGWA